MKKSTKLISLAGISLSSLFFNPVYSQTTKREYYDKDGRKVIHYENKKTNSEWIEYSKPLPAIKNEINTLPSSKNKTGNPNLLKTSQKEWEKAYDKNSQQQSSNKKYTPPKTKTDLRDVLNTTNTALDIINLGLDIANLIQDNQKQKNTNISYSAPSTNNPPIKYNSNPENNVDWWKEEDKKNWWSEDSKEVKKTENKNWWSDEQKQEKIEDKNWLEEKTNEPSPLKSVKSLENALNEQQQKKADAKIQAKKTSKELSDFVEKQAGASPETKIWFDNKYKEADEFYKKFYKNDPEAYAETQKLDKLHKVIGYEAYKMGKKSPAGPVLEKMEKYDEFKKEGGIENFWKEEVKEADEFLKQYESNQKLKVRPDEKELEKMLNTDVYVQKIEKDKYSEQINKIAYESDVAKVIRYRAYQYAKNYSEAGKVIEGIEKIDEMKKNNSGWWDE